MEISREMAELLILIINLLFKTSFLTFLLLFKVTIVTYHVLLLIFFQQMFLSDFTGDRSADALCVPQTNSSRSLATGDMAGTFKVSYF